MKWEALRDAYTERFGKLFDWREVGDEHGRRPPFWLLVFWDPEVPAAPVVYASLGAPGRQVYVASVVPIFALEEALVEATVVAPPLPAPYDLLRTQATRTQFKGFLVAPPEDGSFVVGDEASGRIEVHRLVPVTHAERVLAADKDPREAYRRVREAGALAADPVRTCTVDPKLTDRWKKYDAPGLVRILREHLNEVEQRRAQLRQAAAAPTQLRWYELEAVEVRAYHYCVSAPAPCSSAPSSRRPHPPAPLSLDARHPHPNGLGEGEGGGEGETPLSPPLPRGAGNLDDREKPRGRGGLGGEVCENDAVVLPPAPRGRTASRSHRGRAGRFDPERADRRAGRAAQGCARRSRLHGTRGLHARPGARVGSGKFGRIFPGSLRGRSLALSPSPWSPA